MGSLVAGATFITGVILYGHFGSLDQTTISVQEPTQTALTDDTPPNPDQATAATESGASDAESKPAGMQPRKEPCLSWGKSRAYLEKLETGYRYLMEMAGISMHEMLTGALDACIDRVEEGDAAALNACRECVRAIIRSIYLPRGQGEK